MYNYMTLVQALIANNGETVIILADRLLTKTFGEDFPSYEFEGNQPKIFSRTNVGIGFAGSALYADMAISKVPPDITDFDEITKIISDFAKVTGKSEIENEVHRVTRKDSDYIFSNPEKVPDGVRDYLYGVINKFQLNFECVVAGFDNGEKAKIVFIMGNGETINATNFGVGSIGSGLVFSQIYFDQHQYEITMPETESLFFAYKAKKWAEAHTGVGLKTDILMFRKNGENLAIPNENILMKEIDKIYEEEEKENSNTKNKLLKKLVKNCSGDFK